MPNPPSYCRLCFVRLWIEPFIVMLSELDVEVTQPSAEASADLPVNQLANLA